MNLKTFRAATMADALKQVKESLGPDAIILHTRTVQTRRWMGLRRQEIVEITAGVGLNVGTRGARPRRAHAGAGEDHPPPNPRLPHGAYAAHSTHPPRRIAAAPLAPTRQLLETPAGGAAIMAGISQEVASLKEMVKDLVNQSRQRQCPQVPEDLFDYYLQLIENQVADELATDIIKTLQKQVRAEHFTQPEYMREKIVEEIEKLLPAGGTITRTKATGPHVVALIGPTGVGKTTTIAKLAANLKLREKHRVGLITLDTYRIAAVDQLRRYAEIINTTLRVVSGAEDMVEAMRTMRDYDFILIDTAGRSPNDEMKLNELKTLLHAAEPDEVHLVLSSTASPECIQLAASRFGEVGADKIIFTKLDEAAHIGVVLNTLRRVNKTLSYITTGQDVPNDIEVVKPKRLAQWILGNNRTGG